MDLKKITYPIPNNYSRHYLEVEVGGKIEFVGFLHRIDDIDGIEGTHDEPVRLEQNGEYFEIPDQWRRVIPQHSSGAREFAHC